jgi:hypothetical protein
MGFKERKVCNSVRVKHSKEKSTSYMIEEEA